MPTSQPDALLFITPSCPHCPVVLQSLEELLKQSRIGMLTVVNATIRPELAEQYAVRTAPWLRLGIFTLTGAYSAAELQLWADRNGTEEGVAHYVEHLLISGQYSDAKKFIAEDTRRLKPLLAIVASPDKRIEVRVGVDALLEAYRNMPPLQILLPELAKLSQHTDHRVRADSCNLLGLSGDPAARGYLEVCLNDSSEEVREIAAESLELLSTATSRQTR